MKQRRFALFILAASLLFQIGDTGCKRSSRGRHRASSPTEHFGEKSTDEHEVPALSAKMPCTTTSPGTVIHYSPDEDLEQIDAIVLASAQREIDMSAYSFTDREIEAALADRAAHGVRIRIYRDHAETKSELNNSGRLDSAISDLATLPNIEVRVKSSSTLAHMKAYQVDRRVLRTGSANFSAGAERRQDNDLVFICNQNVIDQFRTKFDQMWDRPDNEVLGSTR